jgi:hypothetical protein
MRPRHVWCESTRIVPIGPAIDYAVPHRREQL